MKWTDENTKDNPTSWDMDGKGTPFKEDDILSLATKTFYAEFLQPFTNGELTVYLDKDLSFDECISILDNNDLYGYTANGTIPPPDPNDLTPSQWNEFVDNGVIIEDRDNRQWLYDNEVYCPYFGIDPDGTFHFGTAYTSTQAGGWDQVATWGGGGFPTGTDTASVGHNVFLESATTSASLTITANTLTTTDGTDWDITISGATAVIGTLNCNSSTCSFGSGQVAAINGIGILGTFNGGSGTHTISCIETGASSSTTLSSGVTTLNGENTTAHHIINNATTSTLFDPNGGEIVLDYGSSVNIESGNDDLYDLTLNDASMSVTLLNEALTVSNDLTITSGELDTGADLSLTVTSATSVTGTLTCNASTISLGSGVANTATLSVENFGTFNGGSGTHTIGMAILKSGSNTTLTSGTTTIDSYWTPSSSFAFSSSATTTSFSNNSGTIVFENNGATDAFIEVGKAADHLYNVEIDYNAQEISQYTNIITDNNLTITSGTFDTGSDRDLTVTGLTSVTGTLTCNASTISLGSGITSSFAITINSGGTLTGGSGNHTYGSILLVGTLTFSLTCGTTTIDSAYSPGDLCFVSVPGATVSHCDGTVEFTMAGTQLWGDFNHDTHTFYDVIVNKPSGTIQFFNTGGVDINMHDFTVTSGTADMSETVTGVSYDLTVSGTTTITDTFIGNDSAIQLGTLNLTSTGTYNATSSTTTLTGNSTISGTWINNNGLITGDATIPILHIETDATLNDYYHVKNLKITGDYPKDQFYNDGGSELISYQAR